MYVWRQHNFTIPEIYNKKARIFQLTKESVKVDLPWSTWAMTDMLRMFRFLSIKPRISSTVKLTYGWQQHHIWKLNRKKKNFMLENSQHYWLHPLAKTTHCTQNESATSFSCGWYDVNRRQTCHSNISQHIEIYAENNDLEVTLYKMAFLCLFQTLFGK